MKRIYLDYAATTPMDMEVKKTMTPYFSDKFGNPGSLHSFGQEAMAAIDEAREKIAKAINAPPAGGFREIIFTGSATEANNLALRGAIKAAQLFSTKTFRTKTTESPYRIIISSIEHDSILETCRDLEKEGVEIIYLPVNKQGIVDLKKLKESLNEQTVLVSIMYANNEIGTVQPIAEIAKIINEFKKEKNFSSPKPKRERSPDGHRGVSELREENFFSNYPLFHTDAVQAFQFLDCDVNNLGVDLMTLSSHKIYGPKGVGALYVANRAQHTLYPIITGGGQEFGLRSGTGNVAGIVGFAKAVELVSNSRELENKRVRQLTDYFWQELKKISPKAELNGVLSSKYQVVRNKLPNIINVYFPNQNSQDLLMALDLNGVAISNGSACSARATKPSHVLKAIGLSDKKIKSSLRFSFGKFTTKEEINRTLKIIKKIKIAQNLYIKF